MTEGTIRFARFLGIAFALAGIAIFYVSIVAPHRRNARIDENSKAVMSALRGMAGEHEKCLRQRGPSAARVNDLEDLYRRCPSIPRQWVEADATGPKPVPFRGHLFLLVRSQVEGERMICAYPAKYGETGRYTWVQEYGSHWWILREDIAGDPVQEDSTAEMINGGWSIMD